MWFKKGNQYGNSSFNSYKRCHREGEIKYYESVEPKTAKDTVNYVGGLRQGEAKFYYESGELASTGNYVDDLAQGEWKSFYKSGELRITGNYLDGLEQGEWKWYYKSGELEYTINYVDGVEQSPYEPN